MAASGEKVGEMRKEVDVVEMGILQNKVDNTSCILEEEEEVKKEDANVV